MNLKISMEKTVYYLVLIISIKDRARLESPFPVLVPIHVQSCPKIINVDHRPALSTSASG
jgi:hypothetical protein